MRQLVETTSRSRLTRARPNGWTSRLLLLEISGQPLFEPEISLIHALHEAGEFSEWAISPATRSLRERINWWINDYFQQRLVILGVSGFPEDENDALEAELGGFIRDVLDVAVDQTIASITSDGQPTSQSLVMDSRIDNAETALQHAHPRDYCDLLSVAIRTSLSRIDTWENASTRRFNSGREPSRVPLAARSCIESLLPDPGEEQSRIEEMGTALGDFLREIIADIAMWSAFSHIAGIYSPEPVDRRLRLTWANVIFGHMTTALLRRTGNENGVPDWQRS